jgi:hypothetical protein
MTHRVIYLHQCTDCATLTEVPPNAYGNAYCDKHRPEPVIVHVDFSYDLPVILDPAA